jgi:hypothetical protein
MPNESEFTRRRAEAFQNLIDDFCSNEINYVDFMDGIKEHRGTNAEGRACIEQIRARGHEDRIPGTFEDDLPPIIVRSSVRNATDLRVVGSQETMQSQRAVSAETSGSSYESDEDPIADTNPDDQKRSNPPKQPSKPTIDPATAADPATQATRPSKPTIDPVAAADAAAQALLASKIKTYNSLGVSPTRAGAAPPIINTPTYGSLPPSIAAGAPHLTLLGNTNDPYLDETFRLRALYATEPERFMEFLLRQRVKQPIPASIWRLICQDRYVDFEKLFVTMQTGYDANDEAKDLVGDFLLLKRDQITSRKPIRNEVDWTRIYETWEAATLLLFPHRTQELEKYSTGIKAMFRTVPDDPHIAINYDREVRDLYSRSPFRLDTRIELQSPFLAQVISVARSAGSASKRNPSFDNPPAKRQQAICENWNMGKCLETPCRGRRKHGVCCVCGDKHQAKDVDECNVKLRARRERSERGFSRTRGVEGTKD